MPSPPRPIFACLTTSHFGTSEGDWLRLQNVYDLDQARRMGRDSGIPPHAA